MEENFKELVFERRESLLKDAEEIKALMTHGVFKGEELFPGQHGEMKANIMLAYRHIEDLRMRLGKAIQAYDGGKSVYPR